MFRQTIFWEEKTNTIRLIEMKNKKEAFAVAA